MFRYLLFPIEALIYGISYGYLQFLIRSPQPLPGDRTWLVLTREMPHGLQWIRKCWPLRPLRPLLIAAKMKQDHALGIADHYDVSNEFYELFLDKKFMFYTCSDFLDPEDTLEDAQQRKADHILGLIDPKPGDKILELGCGWGPMLRHIQQHTGDKQNLRGITLSKEQAKYNKEKHGIDVEFGNFITRDYPAEEYDAIYSIGAWEHVRPDDIPQLLEKLYRALKPGGRLVQHFFCRMAEELPAAVAASQIYFPGSIGSSFRFHREQHEKAGFLISHCSVHDYRPTCRAWFDNLDAERERALELVDVRTFNRYMTFFCASWRYFDDCTGVLTRWVLEKPADKA